MVLVSLREEASVLAYQNVYSGMSRKGRTILRFLKRERERKRKREEIFVKEEKVW